MLQTGDQHASIKKQFFAIQGYLVFDTINEDNGIIMGGR